MATEFKCNPTQVEDTICSESMRNANAPKIVQKKHNLIPVNMGLKTAELITLAAFSTEHV